MEIYTYQISKWRLVSKLSGVRVIDTTVKTGCIEVAPTWNIVLGYKDGSLSEEQYTEIYMGLLDLSINANVVWWDELLSTPKVALGCYCKPGAFCHRLLLKDRLLELIPDSVYLGEITE